MLDLAKIWPIVVLLGVANGAPVATRWALGRRWAWPIDFGRLWPDGRPLLGMAKTFRGLVAAIVLTALAAVPLGYDWRLGAALAGLAMLGDLAASFVKRRLGIEVHGKAPGLDQVLEALLPVLVLREQLALGPWDAVVVIVAFVALGIGLSPLLFRLGLRRRPY